MDDRMNLEIDFENKVVKQGNLEIDFDFRYIKLKETKLKYIKPHWLLNFTTGNFEYYPINPFQSQSIGRPKIVVGCELVSTAVVSLGMSLFEYLDRVADLELNYEK